MDILKKWHILQWKCYFNKKNIKIFFNTICKYSNNFLKFWYIIFLYINNNLQCAMSIFFANINTIFNVECITIAVRYWQQLDIDSEILSTLWLHCDYRSALICRTDIIGNGLFVGEKCTYQYLFLYTVNRVIIWVEYNWWISWGRMIGAVTIGDPPFFWLKTVFLLHKMTIHWRAIDQYKFNKLKVVYNWIHSVSIILAFEKCAYFILLVFRSKSIDWN